MNFQKIYSYGGWWLDSLKEKEMNVVERTRSRLDRKRLTDDGILIILSETNEPGMVEKFVV